jgi:hypothetical protein
MSEFYTCGVFTECSRLPEQAVDEANLSDMIALMETEKGEPVARHNYVQRNSLTFARLLGRLQAMREPFRTVAALRSALSTRGDLSFARTRSEATPEHQVQNEAWRSGRGG